MSSERSSLPVDEGLREKLHYSDTKAVKTPPASLPAITYGLDSLATLTDSVADTNIISKQVAQQLGVVHQAQQSHSFNLPPH